MDKGFSNLTSYSRLSWLNSKYAIDDEVVAPYTPLQVGSAGAADMAGGGFGVDLLNRRVTVGADGLPSTITVTRPASAHGVIVARKISLLAKPMSLDLLKAGAKLPGTVRTPAKVWRITPATVSWSSVVVAGPAVLSLNATIHMDGYMDFSVALSAATPADEHFEVDDIQLHVEWLPQPKDRLYYTGMNQLGQAFESNTSIAWKWNMARKNNFMWAGSPSAGLRVELKDDNDPHRDAAIPGYSQLPRSWSNGGQGGCNFSAIAQAAGSPLSASLTAYSGSYKLKPAVVAPLTNGSRVFRWDMSVTPFKPRNESQHWNLRHFQVGYPGSTFTSAEDVHKTGANVINIHQGVDTMINPFINYPFIPESVELLANYTKTANALGMRVKFYYTVRELSNHAAEIWAMRQLGDEIYERPSCGYDEQTCSGAAWLQEQLGTSYQPAWFDQLAKPNGADAAIAQAGTSGRWLNYYIEGLRQSVAGSPFINGIYYDGILFDRFTMLRVRKTLERNSKVHEPLIDMHTGNDFTGSRRTDAVQYANHWAYVDSLWIGEGFSYDSPPDNWLLEISGMPFGLFSDMLGTPNKYRGMLFGSTGRFGCANPTPMWEFWDAFGMQATDMIGWWEPEIPVTIAATGADGPIHATAYVSKGKKTLIAIGSWSSTNATVKLSFSWSTLGLTEGAVKTLIAPAIPSFQAAQSWGVGESIQVEPKKGWLLVVEPAADVATVTMRPLKSNDETMSTATQAQELQFAPCGATPETWQLILHEGMVSQSSDSGCLRAASLLTTVACNGSDDAQLWRWNGTAHNVQLKGQMGFVRSALDSVLWTNKAGGGSEGCCLTNNGPAATLYGCCPSGKSDCGNQVITLVDSTLRDARHPSDCLQHAVTPPPPPPPPPRIADTFEKLGMMDYEVYESTPFVFNKKKLLMETIALACPEHMGHTDPQYASCSSYYRIRDLESGTVLRNLTESCNHSLGSAFVDTDDDNGKETLWVVGSGWWRPALSLGETSGGLIGARSAEGWGGSCSNGTTCRIGSFKTSDPALQYWESGTVLTPGRSSWNSDITTGRPQKDGSKTYVMAVEQHPLAGAPPGSGWTSYFYVKDEAKTDPAYGDLTTGWKLLPTETHVLGGPGTHGACPTIRFIPDTAGGMYYVISGGLGVYLDRSRNLAKWEPSKQQGIVLQTSVNDTKVCTEYIGYKPRASETALLATAKVAFEAPTPGCKYTSTHHHNLSSRIYVRGCLGF